MFRNFLGLSALVKFAEAPESFAFPPSLAVDHLARHTNLQAITQHVQNPLGEAGLVLIHHGSGTWQGDYSEAWLTIQNCPIEISTDVNTSISIFQLSEKIAEFKTVAFARGCFVFFLIKDISNEKSCNI